MAAPKTIKDALAILKEQGHEIDPILLKYFKAQDYERRRILSVWLCSGCGFEYESEVYISESLCSCGRGMKEIWRRPRDL